MPGKGKGKPCDVMGVPGALPVSGERQIPTTVCAMYGWVGCLDAGVTGLTRVGVLKLGDLASKVLVSSVDTQRWRRGESRTKPGVCDEDDCHLVTHLDRRHRLEPSFFPPPCPCSLHQHLAPRGLHSLSAVCIVGPYQDIARPYSSFTQSIPSEQKNVNNPLFSCRRLDKQYLPLPTSN